VDVLHEGPVPAGLDEAGLREVRAGFLAAAADADRGEVLRRLRERDLALAAHRDGEYPGIAHFGGLGELDPPQLAGLLRTAAAPLTPAALALGAAAWAALRADHPGGLGEIAASRSPELRFLGEAFDRLSREYPSTRDGLSPTERRILAACAGQRAVPAGSVFARIGEREARPFLADRFFFRIVARLAGAETPLLAAEPAGGEVGGEVAAATRLRLTEPGRRVLAGRADHVALNGVDRWVGGVHLHGRDAGWRWDEGTESIA
jgi:hypothetical protein